MTPLDLLTDVFATHRLVKLVRDDKLTEPLRERLWAAHPPESTLLGYLVTCPWCLSIYGAAFLSISRIVFPRFTAVLSRILAISSATSLITEREESRTDGF